MKIRTVLKKADKKLNQNKNTLGEMHLPDDECITIVVTNDG